MTATRLLGIWVLLAVLMSLNGIARELLLRRVLPGPGADIASAALGIAVILLVTRVAFRPLADGSTASLIRVSLVLVILTVGFEFVMGRYVDRKSWSELVANYAIWRGRLWPAVLLTLGLTPFIWGRWIGTAPDFRSQ